MVTRFDHIVIAAATLEQGVEYVRNTLGVDVPPGGEHPLMGTHNHLMNLGDEVFLEIVSTNPNARPPERPRWFALDDPAVFSSLVSQPRLLTWVVNTDDLVSLQASTRHRLGDVTPVSRGNLNWLFAIPTDGALRAGGLLPYAMQWQTEPHPALAMTNLGCRLRSLTVFHPYAAWLKVMLTAMAAEGLVAVEPLNANELPYLSAAIETPTGLVNLDSRLA